ncbi:hypothetical protein F0L68_39135 [Solihabitans fulvus]|uniref:Uncharacterized protein n=1 Tax=Solihabitans fulvus TaxID=1892852 RepID=A0A5B2WHE2_9PSEU|nr:hypothetical protein [Solihabitans fulvus]KAA2250160.1 hypothetical protein F0L68_39135 [Solihabitans fulvus]
MVTRQRSRKRVWIAAVVVPALAGGTVTYLMVRGRTTASTEATAPGQCPDLGAVPCLSDNPVVAVPLAGGRLRLAYAGDRLDGGPIEQATRHGWTLDGHHTYLPDRGLLLLGDGRTRSVPAAARTSQGQRTLLVWSNTAKPGDYSFHVTPTS